MILITKTPTQLSKDVWDLIEANRYATQWAGDLPILLDPSDAARQKQLISRLEEAGVEFSVNNQETLALKLKYIITDIIETAQDKPYNLSVLIAEKMQLNYTYLSNVFSEVYKNTIEQFISECKIAKAKKLLKQEEYSLKRIAAILDYSSPGHFSYRFKYITGMTPTQYRNSKLGKA